METKYAENDSKFGGRAKWIAACPQILNHFRHILNNQKKITQELENHVSVKYTSFCNY